MPMPMCVCTYCSWLHIRSTSSGCWAAEPTHERRNVLWRIRAAVTAPECEVAQPRIEIEIHSLGAGNGGRLLAPKWFWRLTFRIELFGECLNERPSISFSVPLSSRPSLSFQSASFSSFFIAYRSDALFRTEHWTSASSIGILYHSFCGYYLGAYSVMEPSTHQRLQFWRISFAFAQVYHVSLF